MWLNPYGHEAVQHKLKNGLKTPKMHFLPFFELMSDPMKIGQSFLRIKDGSKILMINMISSQQSLPPNISAGSVHA